jgi:hypothetical protein
MKNDWNDNDWNDLESFTKFYGKSKFPIITIYPNKFVFNKKFIIAAKITNNPYVILSFSPKKNAIVFKFFSDYSFINAIKIDIRENATISATRFFTHFGIDTNKYSGKYIPELKDISGVNDAWVLYLDKPNLTPEPVKKL